MANLNDTRICLEILVEAQLPAMVVGTHGIGKTSLGYQVWSKKRAEKNQPIPLIVDTHAGRDLAAYALVPPHEYGLWSFSAPNVSIEEIIGYPLVTDSEHEKDKKVLQYLRCHNFIPPMNHTGGGILLVDELNLGGEDIERAMMSIMLEGRFLDYVLPPGISCVTTMNPPTKEYQSRDMNPPTMDRFCMLICIAETEEVLKHFHEKKYSGDIIDFIMLNEDLLNPGQAETMAFANNKVGTSRGFAFMAKTLPFIKPEYFETSSAVGMAIAMGWLGTSTGGSFTTHMRNPKRRDIVIEVDDVMTKYGVTQPTLMNRYEDFLVNTQSPKVRRQVVGIASAGRVRIDILARTVSGVEEALRARSAAIIGRIKAANSGKSIRGDELVLLARRYATIEDRISFANALLFFNDCPADLVSSELMKKLGNDVTSSTFMAIPGDVESDDHPGLLRDYYDHVDGKRKMKRYAKLDTSAITVKEEEE